MVERLGQYGAEFCRQRKGGWLAELERRGVVVLEHLRMDRVGDLVAAMPQSYVEQAGRAVDQPFSMLVPEIHALAFGDQARSRLEVAVGGKRHPVLFERVGGEAFDWLGEHAHETVPLMEPDGSGVGWMHPTLIAAFSTRQ